MTDLPLSIHVHRVGEGNWLDMNILAQRETEMKMSVYREMSNATHKI